MDKVIVIGWINKGKPADCGETMKNQLMIQKLIDLGITCYPIDFKGWKKRPWVFLQLLWNMIVHKDATLIFSTSTINVYPMMKLMKRIGWKQKTIQWVIGGSLGDKVKNGTFDRNVIGYIQHTIVESKLMVHQLEECGIKGVFQLPNFKPISYYPDIKSRVEEWKVGLKRPVRFVFLSRIMCEKGCDYILEAAKHLNEDGFENRYTIDFYGKIAEPYKKVFLHKIGNLPNVTYKGFLSLQNKQGYDKLAEYDLMLFPTYWKGEGFAGVFIDAFISGVPMIISDWAHNRQFMKEGETALFIPVHNVIALRDRMQECIKGHYPIGAMAMQCQQEAEIYNIDKVITLDLLNRLDLQRK